MNVSDTRRTGFTYARVGPLRIIVILSVIVAIYYTVFQLTDLNAIIAILTGSSWVWVSVAITATLLSYVTGGIVQYISGNFTGRLDRLVTIGFAGSFLNHFLPLSIGTIGLTAEYYHRLGRPRAQAILMASIPIIIGSATIILIALILSPSVIVQLGNNIGSRVSTFPILIGLSVVIAIAGILIVRYKQKIIKNIVEATEYFRSVKNTRLVLLIASVSLIQTLVSAYALLACVHAINGDITFVTAVVLLIISVLVSEGTPIPGGLGATDVILILGLVNTGFDPIQAVAVTVLFRFVTFALPVIPGAIALAQIDRSIR